MTSIRARPEQGGKASNIGFLKLISMAAFEPELTFENGYADLSG